MCMVCEMAGLPGGSKGESPENEDKEVMLTENEDGTVSMTLTRETLSKLTFLVLAGRTALSD